MDILSHGLWAGVAAKGINLKKKRKLNIWLAAFWGVFPDLFAFTIPFVWLFLNLITGSIHLSDLHQPTGTEPENKLLFGNGNTSQVQSLLSYLTSLLYDISHSLIIFLLVFGLAILIRKYLKKEDVVPWEMFGWLLHILCDIPTHSYAFYPTPFFWPVFGWKFNGYSWGHLWFIIANYSAIAVAYLTVRVFEKKS